MLFYFKSSLNQAEILHRCVIVAFLLSTQHYGDLLAWNQDNVSLLQSSK
jgi:hypothetical protein